MAAMNHAHLGPMSPGGSGSAMTGGRRNPDERGLGSYIAMTQPQDDKKVPRSAQHVAALQHTQAIKVIRSVGLFPASRVAVQATVEACIDVTQVFLVALVRRALSTTQPRRRTRQRGSAVVADPESLQGSTPSPSLSAPSRSGLVRGLLA